MKYKIQDVVPMMRGLDQLKAAITTVSQEWNQGKFPSDLGCEKYPFRTSFDDFTPEIIKWCEQFISELIDYAQADEPKQESAPRDRMLDVYGDDRPGEGGASDYFSHTDGYEKLMPEE